MISVDEAQAAIAGALAPLPVETVALSEAAGRVLAEPVVAHVTQPPFAASAMDGYAVRLADVRRAGAQLRVCGVSSAGGRFDRCLPEGCAVRIFTGAPVPDGADHVIVQENVDPDGEAIIVREPADKAGNIRAAGIDFCKGDALLAHGRRLSGPDVGLAAAANVPTLSVHKRPRVALIANGDELVSPGAAPAPDQIICSIPYALQPMIAAWGGAPEFLGIARDSLEDLRRYVDMARDFDLIVPIGGASVGDRDFMHAAFAEADFEPVFRKIAVKPGKPTWFGKMGKSAVLGLPGNPGSALVIASLFLKPAVSILSGATSTITKLRQGTISAAIAQNGSRETYLRARLIDSGDGSAKLEALASQDSSLLSIMSAADILIRRPAAAPALAAGEPADYLPIV